MKSLLAWTSVVLANVGAHLSTLHCAVPWKRRGNAFVGPLTLHFYRFLELHRSIVGFTFTLAMEG